MNRLLDQFVLFTLCLAVYLMHESGYYVVVPVIIAVIVIAVSAYFKNPVLKLCCFAAYCLVCVFVPLLLLFLPECAMTLNRRDGGGLPFPRCLFLRRFCRGSSISEFSARC